MTFGEGIVAAIAGFVLGLLAYIWKLKSNLEDAKSDKAELQVNEEIREKKEALKKAGAAAATSLEKYNNLSNKLDK